VLRLISVYRDVPSIRPFAIQIQKVLCDLGCFNSTRGVGNKGCGRYFIVVILLKSNFLYVFRYKSEKKLYLSTSLACTKNLKFLSTFYLFFLG